MERLTEYHDGVAVIKDKALLPQAMARLAAYEDTETAPEEYEKVNTFAGSQIEKMLIALQEERKKHRWIPVTERLPEPGEDVIVTIHRAEWISDYDNAWVAEKTHHPELRYVSLGFANNLAGWSFCDSEYGDLTAADESFGDDLGQIYEVVEAWMPLPEPYTGGKDGN